jgi:hypothetical protein
MLHSHYSADFGLKIHAYYRGSRYSYNEVSEGGGGVSDIVPLPFLPYFKGSNTYLNRRGQKNIFFKNCLDIDLLLTSSDVF